MNCFVFSLLGGWEGNLESILLISSVADLSDPIFPLQGTGMPIYNSSGCRNHSVLHGGWDIHSSAIGLQTQQGHLIYAKNNSVI
jgi:hypothetical protein